MFRRRPRTEPPPPPPLDVVEEAIVPIERSGKPQAAPVADEPAPVTDWRSAAFMLATYGFETQDCPHLCRRKGEHAHMRHDAASTDLIVSPAAVERSGA